MADPRLVQYIKSQMDAGFGKSQIYSVLIQTGWFKDEVDAAFREIERTYATEPSHLPSPEPSGKVQKALLPKSPGFLWKLRTSFFRPGRLFEVVKGESDIGNALKFYGLVSFTHLLIALTLFFFALGILTNFLNTSFLNYLLAVLPLLSIIGIESIFYGYFIYLAATFVAAGIVHAFVFILRGSRGFFQTYKAVAYSSGITLLLWPVLLVYLLLEYFSLSGFGILINILILVMFSLGFFLVIRGLSRLHEMSAPKAGLAVLAPAAVLAAVLLVFSPELVLGLLGLFSGGQSSGFEGFDASGWSYQFDGTFSISLKNSNGNAVTINTVTADCGSNGDPVVLETSDPTHLEDGDSITFSTDLQKCITKEPGEPFSVPVNVRYLNENNMIAYSSTGTVSGKVPNQ